MNKILRYFHLRQWLIFDRERTLHLFPVEDQGLGFRRPSSHPGCLNQLLLLLDVPSSPLQHIWAYQVCPAVFLATRSNSPPGGDRLTALPLSLPKRPKHTAAGSDDTTTKSIIDLWPKMAWYQVHLWTTLYLNMLFVMDNPWLAQKSKNKTPFRFRSGRPFLPIKPLKVTPSMPTWALKAWICSVHWLTGF